MSAVQFQGEKLQNGTRSAEDEEETRLENDSEPRLMLYRLLIMSFTAHLVFADICNNKVHSDEECERDCLIRSRKLPADLNSTAKIVTIKRD